MGVRHLSAPSLALAAKLNLLGESPVFKRVLEQIDRFAACDAAILICGETGTGKELAARAIHYLSARGKGPFIPINCGSIPDSLFGSELFGYSRGAFTDARESRQGLIAQADKGTLFLDELETLSARGQVALLRFLQDHEYRPLGQSAARTADVRVIGATNDDLAAISDRGEFRRDLLYRVNVLSVSVPPLRAREDDVIVLAQAFLRKLCAQYGARQRSIHTAALARLKAYGWPGNVRELENLVHREFLLTDDMELRFETIGDTVAPASAAEPNRDPGPPAVLTDVGFREAKARAIADFERAYISELLERAHGNVSLAARLAGKERSRLGRLVRKYSLSTKAYKPGAARHTAT